MTFFSTQVLIRDFSGPEKSKDEFQDLTGPVKTLLKVHTCRTFVANLPTLCYAVRFLRHRVFSLCSVVDLKKVKDEVSPI